MYAMNSTPEQMNLFMVVSTETFFFYRGYFTFLIFFFINVIKTDLHSKETNLIFIASRQSSIFFANKFDHFFRSENRNKFEHNE